MKAKLIIIGNELLYGSIADTNGPWLAKWLDSKGIELSEIQIVADQKEALLKSFKDAWSNNDLVITSGGIGPTEDDMTKSLLAEFFEKKMNPSGQAALVVEDNYKKYDRQWTPELNNYHHVPDDFIITKNPKGLAPGLVYQKNKKMLMAAPGVPKELRAMAEEEFFPIIKDYFKGQFSHKERVIIRTAKIPEEKIFGELCPSLWKELELYGSVSSLPQIIGVDIIVTLDREKLQVAKKEILALLNNGPLKEFIWHYGSETIPELIIKEAIDKKLTFSFAESCTGGLCASRITDIPGSSEVFLGSLVTYSNDAKTNILGVSGKTIIKYGAVSPQTVEEMAVGAKEKLGADLCIALSGIAGPSGGSPQKPVGTLTLASANKKEIKSEILQFSGDRIRLKERFSETALFALLQMIRNF